MGAQDGGQDGPSGGPPDGPADGLLDAPSKGLSGLPRAGTLVRSALDRAVAGLQLAAAAQVGAALVGAGGLYPWWFRWGVVPAWALATALVAGAALLRPGSAPWAAAGCVLASFFTAAAAAGLHGVPTGATDVAEPLVGLGVFGAGMSGGRAAVVAGASLLVTHRWSLVAAGTGTVAGHVQFTVLECGSFAAALVGGAWLARRVHELDAEEERERGDAVADARRQAVRDAHRERARLLHDVALPTLTALGHGTAGTGTHLRGRCAEEAALLRGHIALWQEGAGLASALAQVTAGARSRGLLVGDPDLPPGLPQPSPVVVWALTRAVHEALTNVARHSGQPHAMVTVSRHGPQGVRVSVADPGRGFDPRSLPGDRLGVAGSVRSRMDDVGGRASVSSRPGRGTVVALTWSEQG